MKKKFIVANWKSNKTSVQAKEWIEEVSNFNPSAPIKSGSAGGQILNDPKEIIICPSFTDLSLLKQIIVDKGLPFKLGAQSVSQFSSGAYTGEINAAQLKEFCQYVLIGHSERRTHFAETDDIIQKKVIRAKEAGLKPIVCVQNATTPIPREVLIVAYEPLGAIGTGQPDTPENADTIAKAIKEKFAVAVLYGGSVTKENVAQFTQKVAIDGVLVGGASLVASDFSAIITHA